jgi:D-aspartate ligase
VGSEASRGGRNSLNETLPPAVLLGGSANAVSAARGLASAGVPVYALGGSSDNLVRFSRHCRRFVPAAGHDLQASWLAWLRQERSGAVLIPCEDDGLELLATERDGLVDLGYRPVEAEPDLVLAMLDKQQTYELARAAGVETPRTVLVSARGDLDRAGAEIGFPCALKPRYSHRFVRRGLGVEKAFQVRTREELERAFEQTQARGLAMLVTEIIPGAEDRYCSSYTYLDRDCEPVVVFTKRKLRQCPPYFGLGSYHVTKWDEQVAEAGLRFVQGVGLRGLANVEFKRDERDERLKLIECNYRLSASNELIRRGGLDLALLCYRRALGLEDPPLRPCPDGLHLWLPIEDLRAFRSLRRAGEISLGEWASSLLHRQIFPVFSLDDPVPGLMNLIRPIRRRQRSGNSHSDGAG